MNALRLTQGVEAELFTQRTAAPGATRASPPRRRTKGLLQVEPDRLAATPRGQLFLNDLLQYFLN
jgi:oxygen-independent coproporphyrinogen-3 oxidase